MIEQQIENQMRAGDKEKKNFFSFFSSPKFIKNIFICLIVFFSIFSLLGNTSKASAAVPVMAAYDVSAHFPNADNTNGGSTGVVPGLTYEYFYGNIVSTDSSVSARGACVSTSNSTPTLVNGASCFNDTLFTPPFTAGAWAQDMGPLSANTTYYFSTFATNASGTGYWTAPYTFTTGSYPVVTSPTVSNIGSTTATIGGNYSTLGVPVTAGYDRIGYAWGTTSGSTQEYAGSINYIFTDTTVKTTTGTFAISATGFPACTTIYYHAMIQGLYSGRAYSPEASFQTTGCAIPAISNNATTPTASSSYITTYTDLTSAGAPANDTVGIKYGLTSGSRTNTYVYGAIGSPQSAISNMIFSLASCTTYYYEGYATNTTGTAYSPERTITTTGCAAPTLGTATSSGVTATSATLGASISSTGTPAYTERGIVYAVSPTVPTITDNKTIISGSGTGAYSQSVALNCGTTYIVKGYAINTQGTVLSAQTTVTTGACVLPTIQATTTVTSLGGYGFTLNSNILTLGAPNYTSKGFQTAVCVGCSFSGIAVSGLTTGAYSNSFSVGSACNQYNTRAYVTNANGTVYSNELAVTTTGCVAPTLTATPTQSAITDTTATLGGSVVSGGVPVWSPIASDRGIEIGLTTGYGTSFSAGAGGTGAFTVPATGLSACTLYHFRSYATNFNFGAGGPGYSSDTTFTTTGCTTPMSSVGAPTGSVVQGSVLTAGALSPAGATVTYQWQNDVLNNGVFSNISGATSSTYTSTSGVLGDKIKVCVTGTGSYSGTVCSTAVGVITTPLTAIAAPTGTLAVGSILTVGALTPAAGSASYVWQSATTSGGTYTAISGATNSTYTLTATEATKYIKVVATGISPYTGTATSTYVGPITTPVTAIAAITGTTTVGSTLTAGTRTPSGATVSYQWAAATTCGGSYTNISGATNSTYVLTTNEIADYIKVTATGTGSYSGTVTSACTAIVTTPMVSVSITGSTIVGFALNGTTLSPAGASVTYQWQSATTCGGSYGSIAGATNSTYTLTATEATKYIKVIATGTGGYTGAVTSACAGPITTNVTAVGTPTGSVVKGSVLTAGTLTPAAATVSYQWQADVSGNAVFSNISGATSSTYTTTDSEVGDKVRVVVTGTGSYTGTANSTAVGVITTPLTAIATPTGTLGVGSVLTAGALTAGALSPTASNATWQWSSATTSGGTYTSISGATNSTFTLTSTQNGQYLKVTATGISPYTGSIASAYVGPVFTNLISIGAVTGTTTVGSTLTAGTISPAGASVNYQWQNDVVGNGVFSNVASGGTSNTYVLTLSELADDMRVCVTGTGNYVGTVCSAPTSQVTTPFTAIGAITGSTVYGSVLTAGTLTPAAATVSYQWSSSTTSNGTYNNISGATSSTYTLVSTDIGDYLKVTATGINGYTGTFTSAASSVILQKQLTIANPSLTLSKVYDGTNTAAVTPGTLSGKVGADVVSINTTTATYNSVTVGTGKTITVVYTLTGANAGNYIVPGNYTDNTGIITDNTLTVSKTGTGTGTITTNVGGINCGVTCTNLYTNGTSVTLTATPDATSNFVSWSGDADCTDGVVTMAGAKTCTANFTLKTYALVINASTGTGSGSYGGTAAGTYSHGTAVSVTATPVANSVFASWNASGAAVACNGTTTSPCAFSLTSAATLNAVYNLNLFTVTFDINGGDGGSTLAQSLVYNTPTALRTNGFTRTGYTFDGWATSAGGAVVYADGGSYTIGAADVTLYAHWIKNSYMVTFNTNGGDGGSTAPQSLVYNTPTALTTNGFTKTGYTFDSWNTVANGSGTKYLNGANYTIGAAGVNLYAQWTVNPYTFTAVPSIGTLTCNGGVCASSYNYGTSLSMSATSVPGYTVALSSTGTVNGCVSAGGGAGVAATCTAVIPAGNTGITATYTPISYTYTFAGNGATVDASPLSVTQNYLTSITTPIAPTKIGYTFAGWSPVIPATMPVGGGTSTAQWNINSYNVTFNINGGNSGSMSPQSLIYNTPTALTTNGFTKTQYTFTGWNTASNGSGTTYLNNANYTIGAADVT